MLISMTVHNIALIENLQIDFQKGMQVLSGETGAGKSIIVDSINLILGERADRTMIRTGCDRATVEAFLDISSSPEAQEILNEQMLSFEGNVISIQREISTGDRNNCRVCGSIVPLAFLKKLTALLVDLHGQHDHQSLLDADNHMAFLDAFGGDFFREKRGEVSEAYSAWRERSTAFASVRKEYARREERLAYLNTHIRELEEADIQLGEILKLEEEKKRWANAEKIDSALRAAYSCFLGTGEKSSAVDSIRAASVYLRTLETIHPDFKALSDRVSSLYYEAEELCFELRDRTEGSDFSPERYEAIQARLDLLRRIERKYGAPSDELVSRLKEMKEEQRHFENLEEQQKLAEAEYKHSLSVYRGKASELTRLRAELAVQFENNMEQQLHELGMPKARFSCVFEGEKDKTVKPTPEGDDRVVFYIAPNPGEPLMPLDKTASGGELSRIMLAMKTAGAECDRIPCLIFDEIDTGISGHTAEIVAEKMASIARYHQVLCVTHLAQIASMADSQYLVEKKVVDGRTVTSAALLTPEGRIGEIARLIGVTNAQQESGYAHAKALLADAAEWKAKHCPS